MSDQVEIIMGDTGMERTTREEFVKKARACEPKLTESQVLPTHIVQIEKVDEKARVRITDSAGNLPVYVLGKGDSVCLDFGDHQVGYVTLKLKSVGSPQDAPAYIRLRFGEVAKEILEDPAEYDGWISQSWIQQEFLHIDVLPAVITLPRRYAFRYLELYAIATSKKWKLVVEEVTARTVSAVAGESVAPVDTDDALIRRIDQVGLRTLKNCMQSVFEDGPKRDRRLWLGDLRLQALANYETFKENDLVKRCLYLFGGLTRADGRIGACLFIEPEYLVDDTFFFDYSLFFIPTLYDYYQATGDRDTLEDLWDAAYTQVRLAKQEFDQDHLLKCGDDFSCFIDWKAGLDKQASAQAVYIYCARRALEMAKVLGEKRAEEELEKEIADKTAASLKYLWDKEEGLFVSGGDRQVSYASQAWMLLAGVIEGGKARAVLQRLKERPPEMGMVSPYMNHHYVEALLTAGEKEKALEYLKYYWGGMVKEGADTFWELYNPQDPEESPYGSSMVNSYCHAWSCTPVYLLRKYF